MQLKFNSFTKNIDGQEYCSEVETLAENMIESNEQDASIVYPAPGKFITVRAANYRITDTELVVDLPYPIYKLVSVKLIPNGVRLYANSSSGGEYITGWNTFVDGDGNAFVPDIAKYILTEMEYAALPIASGGDVGTADAFGKYKQTAFTYSGNKIKIRAESYPLIGNAFEQPVYAWFIGILPLLAPKRTYKAGTTWLENGAVYEDVLNPVKAKDWEFQIEYIPMTSATKMKAHKAEATTQAYTQVVNQRAEVNNAEAFGKYLHTTAQKTGTEKLAIAKIYKRLEDVPPIGAVVKHNGERYRLIANSWNITNPFTFAVTHLLSKNWSSKSKHIAVDQKYRNWNIPFDSYIWLTLYMESFVEIGERMTADGVAPFNSRSQCIKDMFTTDAQTVQPLRNMFFYNGEGDGAKGVVLPTTTMAIGNSFIISATVQDNLSAGLRISATDSEFCEEVLYCNDDGTLEKARVVLSQQLINYDAAAYPAIITGDNPKNTAGVAEYGETLYVDKDPGEALKITIQAHFLPNADWVVIGNALAQTVPYISDKKRTFRLYALKQYIRDGVDKLDAETLKGSQVLIKDDKDGFSQIVYLPPLKPPSSGDIEIVPPPGTDENPFNKFSDMVLCNGTVLSFIDNVNSWLENNSSFYKAWAITDGENNLLIGSNDISKRTVRFNWRRRRSKK